MITDHDRLMIVYFHQERDDITRWCNWEKRKSDIAAKYPELIAAMDNFEIAKRTLDAIVEKIERDNKAEG